MSEVRLREAERLELTVLVDNYTDLIPGSTEGVRRAVLYNKYPNAPLAEHGLSCLLKVASGSEEHVVMMDAGMTGISLMHNMKILEVPPAAVETVVLSHGHIDHYGGLVAFLSEARQGVPVILHPDALLERRLNPPETGPRKGRKLDEKLLEKRGTKVHKREKASTVASDLVLVTGEVERTTSFERGFLWAEARIGGQWVPDPFRDDQGVAVHIKGKGLVVLQGCSHAGIINTVKHARKVSGVDKVHAVMGGFHLNGPLFEPLIGMTIEEMRRIGPDRVVPMHCTGWKAMNEFSRAMPDRFALNVVGTTYLFQSS